ncbi:DUF4760 domain-containing protein [Acinetobacter pittii]|uniref:DUF4760 domain-containing protein n=1 Tax=Acinetobacter pittii TaxID=48296 RepID=UPI003B438D1A
MVIDNILLLRTFLLFLPFFGLWYFFDKRIKDKFFLKPRTHIQLNFIMIALVIIFLELVYWNLFLRDYSFIGFGLTKIIIKGKEVIKPEVSNTLIVLLGTVVAILGWLFPTRANSVAATRSHTIHTLMDSRLSEIYNHKVTLCTEVFVTARKQYGESYILTKGDFDGLDQKYKDAAFYLLNYLEFVATGIRFGDLDENLMRNMMKTIINTNFTFFEEIIKDKQLKAPTVYEHLTALQKRWSCIK